jgi:hypothetical protein
MNCMRYVSLNSRRRGASECGYADRWQNDLCLSRDLPHFVAHRIGLRNCSSPRSLHSVLDNFGIEPKQRKDSQGKRILNCRQFEFQELPRFSFPNCCHPAQPWGLR